MGKMTLEEITSFLELHIPFAVKPVNKAKTTFVNPFSSDHGTRQVIDHLAEMLHEKLTLIR